MRPKVDLRSHRALVQASQSCKECGRLTTRMCIVCHRPLCDVCGQIEHTCSRCFVRAAKEVEA